MLIPELNPAKDLNPNEWLAREALWAIAKSPLSVQWERWKAHPDIKDPAGVLGLVVGGNLQRASVNLSQSELFDEGSRDRNIILGRVAEHIGKLVGGLLAMHVMVAMPSEDWNMSYAHHLDRVISATQHTLPTESGEGGLTEASAYYDMLRPAHNGVLKDPSNDDDWKVIKNSILEAEVSARTTWQNFIISNPDALIVPGATPRSTGPEIKALRNEFEPYAQLITDLTTHPTL